MSNSPSIDPRAKRTRDAFERAFGRLLSRRPLQRITVTDIAEEAGYARHTFYNHYETKEDLLAQLIDRVLEKFFVTLGSWELLGPDEERDLDIYTSFFAAWSEHSDVVGILNKTDFDLLLVNRLKAFFARFYEGRIARVIPGVDEELAKYVIHFNAYTLLGILKPWLSDGMRHRPETMAGFLLTLTGSEARMKAVEDYKGVIR